MLERSTSGRATLGADRGYDTRDFVAALRGRDVTPHVARDDRHRVPAARRVHPQRAQQPQTDPARGSAGSGSPPPPPPSCPPTGAESAVVMLASDA